MTVTHISSLMGHNSKTWPNFSKKSCQIKVWQEIHPTIFSLICPWSRRGGRTYPALPITLRRG